jgi:hypothetical protein
MDLAFGGSRDGAPRARAEAVVATKRFVSQMGVLGLVSFWTPYVRESDRSAVSVGGRGAGLMPSSKFDAEYERRRTERIAAMRALSFGEDAIAAAIAKEDEVYLMKRAGGNVIASMGASSSADVEKPENIQRTTTPGIRDVRLKKNDAPSVRSEHLASQSREGFSRSTTAKAAPSGSPSVIKFGALPRSNPAVASESPRSSSVETTNSMATENKDAQLALNAAGLSIDSDDEYIKGRKELPPGVADFGEGTFVQTADGGIFIAKGVTVGVRVEDGSMSYLTGSNNDVGVVDFEDAFGKHKKQTPEDLLLSFRNQNCAFLPSRG